MTMLMLAAITFVGTHFLLSHPLRSPLLQLAGPGGFSGIYSAVAVVTIVWMTLAYRSAPTTVPWWSAGNALWTTATALMLFASVLLMGSLVGNPAFPQPGAPRVVPASARGVYAITRHPMMWSFAIWAVVHSLVYPIAKTFVVTSAIMLLSLVGAALQDRKKERLQPELWQAWERRTSYLPFLAILQGRAAFGRFGLHATAGGLLVWLVATWAHKPLAGWPAGIWRWLA